jgi:hypothetical protein
MTTLGGDVWLPMVFGTVEIAGVWARTNHDGGAVSSRWLCYGFLVIMLWLPGRSAADIFKATGVATPSDSGHVTNPVDDVSVVTLKWWCCGYPGGGAVATPGGGG